MRCLDQLYTAYPCYGSRQMSRHLVREGYAAGPAPRAAPDAQDGPGGDLLQAALQPAAAGPPGLPVPAAESVDRAAAPGVVQGGLRRRRGGGSGRGHPVASAPHTRPQTDLRDRRGEDWDPELHEGATRGDPVPVQVERLRIREGSTGGGHGVAARSRDRNQPVHRPPSTSNWRAMCILRKSYWGRARKGTRSRTSKPGDREWPSEDPKFPTGRARTRGLRAAVPPGGAVVPIRSSRIAKREVGAGVITRFAVSAPWSTCSQRTAV